MSKNALITGASRGIGKATAKYFAKHGYRLSLCCKDHFDSLNEFAKELSEKYQTECFAFCTDVSDSKQVNEMVDNSIKALGQIDVLINNAGISSVGLLTDLSDEEWRKLVDTNLSSVFYFCRAVVPEMVKRKEGAIINVSSIFGTYGASCEVAYSATKGGVNSFSRALAKELGPSNIPVNAVTFGTVETAMNSNLTDAEKEALSEGIPVGRFAKDKEAGAFLLSLAESPSYLTGAIIPFDGGWI